MAVTLQNKNSQAPAAQGAAQAPATPRIPFVRAARKKSILSFATTPLTFGAGATPFGVIQVPANGFMSCLNLQVDIASSGNSANVALATTGAGPDQPFSVVNQVQVTTSSGDTLINSISGYDLAMVIKYGAFGQGSPYSDPRMDPGFTALTTGGAATAGSGSFCLRIPFEIDQSSGYCSMPNLSANRSYNIQGLIAPLSTIFSTPPNGTTTVTITATAEYWSVPNPTNAQGDPQEVEPYGNGSFHVLQNESIPVNPGGGIYQLHNVGNVIRMPLFIFRDAAGTRIADTNWPNITEIMLNNDQLFYLPKADFLRSIASAGWGAQFGTATPAANSPGGRDTGVWPILQFLASGNSTLNGQWPRNQYLPTLDASLLQIRGLNWGAAGTLTVQTSSVVPKNSASLYAPHF